MEKIAIFLHTSVERIIVSVEKNAEAKEKTDDLLLQSALEIYTASGATIAPSDCQDNTV